MKLVLTSYSVTIPAIAEKIVELVGKPACEIKFAIINEAYAVETKSHKWLFKNFDTIRKYFEDKNLQFVNLLALDMKEVEKRIDEADIIYCCGGNTEYLQSVFIKTGFDKLLPKLLKTKLWVGSSAGSMVVGRLPSVETLKVIYKETELYGINDYLKLYNFSILPHTGRNGIKFQACIEESEKQKYPVYSLSDTSAVVIDGDKEYMIGSDGCKLLGGKVIEEMK